MLGTYNCCVETKKQHKGSLGDHIQETNSEDQSDTDLLFPLEVQIPDNPLR